MDVSRIIFWEPSLSPHKYYLVKAIKELNNNIEVIYCSEIGISDERKSQGWQSFDTTDVEVKVSPSDHEILRLIGFDSKQTLHIFSGIRNFRIIETALKNVLLVNAAFAILSEPRDDTGWKGILKYFHSWLTEIRIRRQVKFVLAIGANGPPWFKKVGYKNIYPFAYFLENAKTTLQPECVNTKDKKIKRNIVIAYVGRLVRAKGVHLIPELCKICPDYDFRVVGIGKLERLVKEESLALKNLKYEGVIPSNKMNNYMSQIDILVAPSITKDDGWGAVVSEALLSGAAVVTTPYVGASMIIKDNFGYVVPPNIKLIKKAIESIIKNKYLSDSNREYRSTWARDNLTSKAGASQLLEILSNAS